MASKGSPKDAVNTETNSMVARLFSAQMKRTIEKHSTVSKNGAKFEVSVPGISFSDFDRGGTVGMNKIAWYFGMVRYFVQARPDYCTSMAIGSRTIFLLQIEYEIDERFYATANDRSVWFSIKLTSELLSLGRTTITTRSVLYSGREADYDQRRSLIAVTYKQALVDPVMRKSVALSDDFLAKYSRYCNNAGLEPYAIPNAPSDAFSCEMTMRYSDTDVNRHVNNTNYIMFCYDCATLAATSGGYLRRFNGDVSFRRAKTVKCSYMLESKPGDVIRAVVWEDAVHSDALHFLLSRESKNVFYCFMMFYPELKIASKL